MKKTMLIALILAIAMLLTPLIAQGKTEVATDAVKETLARPQTNKTETKDYFRLLDSKTEKIIKISAEDYVFGVVASEMPALYEDEALKAQAVASYTYACYKRNMNKEKEYDLTTDFSIDQCYQTQEQLKEKWGDDFEKYSEKIESAVKSVYGKTLMYQNEPILAVYHALSSGNTYSAEDVWGKEIPYLKGVPSNSDVLEDNYIAVKEFDLKEIKKLFKYNKNKKTFGKSVCLENGLVESIAVFGEKFSGNEVRSALGLPSANFTVAENDSKYIFTCKGYGHGVGMSQKGANSMAKQGFSYQEILLHYYSGAVLV